MTELKQLNESISALVIVDVQPTFCEGGALPVQGGNSVAKKIRLLLESNHGYELVVTTQDWHINPGTHFSDNPNYVDTWPEHGRAGSVEAELHCELENLVHCNAHRVKKGMYNAAYSGFEGVDEFQIPLNETLKSKGVTHVDIVGLAFDYCVKSTAIDSVNYGYKTRVLTRFSAAVHPENKSTITKEIKAAGVEVVES